LPPVPLGPLRKELRHYPQVKLKNLQWQKLDARSVDNTIWKLENVNESELEDDLDKHGVFVKIESLFPAKVNNFFEKKLKAKVDEKKDAVTFLNREKARNISMYSFIFFCYKSKPSPTCVLFRFGCTSQGQGLSQFCFSAIGDHESQ
jgi:hypothetical protein